MEAEQPAQKVIRLLGVKRIAATCDLTTDAVYKWSQRPGGLIPAQHQGAVLALAASRAVELTASDLIGVAA